MAAATIDEEKLKDLLKSAVIEVFEERRDLLQGIVEDALEDIALSHAIDEGINSGSISRGEVFAVLEGAQ